jgi:hypothetical protein
MNVWYFWGRLRWGDCGRVCRMERIKEEGCDIKGYGLRLVLGWKVTTAGLSGIHAVASAFAT